MKKKSELNPDKQVGDDSPNLRKDDDADVDSQPEISLKKAKAKQPEAQLDVASNFNQSVGGITRIGEQADVRSNFGTEQRFG
jgi:hypothetical protein